ncbi:hypothetical protein BH10BAC1_BH10BAC1_07490 [soil metagenome]
MKNTPNSFFTFQKILFALLFLTTVEIVLAQPQQREWALPGNDVKFTPSPSASPLPITSSYAGAPPFSASNSMTDYNGNLMFYVLDEPGAIAGSSDINIYGKDGFIIDKLKFASWVGSTNGLAGEIGIVPVPNSCLRYYIIVGVGDDYLGHAFSHPEYAILDMTKPNKTDPTKFGALEYFSSTVNTQNLQNLYYSVLQYAWNPKDNGSSGSNYENNRFGIAITPYRSATNDYFLFVNGFSSLYRFVIKSNGIFLDTSAPDGGIIDYISLLGISLGDNVKYAEMELIKLATTGNYRMAKPYSSRYTLVVDIAYNTGTLIPGTNKTLSVINAANPLGGYNIRGLEFSPNGDNLYFTYEEFPGPTEHMGHFDLTATSPTPQLLAYTGTSLLGNSFIEMGFDGKMYFNSGSELMSLSPPFYAPSSANWNSNAVALPSLTIQTLPDQMDGQDYKDKPIFINYTAGTLGATTYTTYTNLNQVWTPTSNPFGGAVSNPVGSITNPITIVGEIVIPAGYNIVMQGMNFKFRPRTITYVIGVATTQPGARVVVQNSTSALVGGRLTLTNQSVFPTILTSDNVCSAGMWEGVEVWGDNLVSQGTLATSKQGALQLFSSLSPGAQSTTISNAYYGALSGKRNLFPFINILNNTGGAIIQANANTEFLNNQIGVYFMPYNVGNNLSKFTSNKFTTNATFVSADGANPFAMAYLNDVKGIYFKTSTFTNTPTVYSQTATIGSVSLIGIRSYHSSFYCVPAVFGSTVGCNFNNFKYGIYATYYNNTKTVTVSNATFNNNFRGAYLSGAQMTPSIVGSAFNVMAYSAPVTAKRAYGLYLNACNAYKVEANDFTTVGGLTTVNNIGCIVNNSGPYTNQIYRNTFHQIWAGIQAQNTNCYSGGVFPDPKNNIGLQLLCNSFTTIKEMDLGITSGCIDFHQGVSLSPAGNKFSHSTNTAYNDYFTYSNINDLAFVGYIHNSDFPQTPQPGRYTPAPAIIPGSNGLAFNSSTQCLSTLGSHLTASLSDLKANILNYQAQKASLQSLIDAGKDISLINAINSSMSLGSLKNLLLSKSPYLSDEVLIAVINRSNPLPPGHIKEIIIANSPVTQPVKDALNLISLPNGIRNQINGAQTGKSQRKITEDNIYYYQFQINVNKNDIIRAYVNDTTVDVQTDTIIQKIIDFEGIDPIGIGRKEMLADLYTEKQDYVSAEAMLTETEATHSKQNFAKIKRVNKSLKQSGLTTSALVTDIVKKQKVDEVASENNYQGYEPATNILQQEFEQSYSEPIDELIPSMHSYVAFEQETSQINLLGLYPNPSNGLMQLDYSLNVGEVGELKIFDVTGRLVAQYNLNANENILQINQNILNDGLYLYQVLTNGQVVGSDKLIITK